MVSIESALAELISILISDCFRTARNRVLPITARLQKIEDQVVRINNRLELLRSLQGRDHTDEVNQIIQSVFDTLRKYQ